MPKEPAVARKAESPARGPSAIMEPHSCKVSQPDMILGDESKGWVRPHEPAEGGHLDFGGTPVPTCDHDLFVEKGEHLRGHPHCYCKQLNLPFERAALSDESDCSYIGFNATLDHSSDFSDGGDDADAEATSLDDPL